jgi:Cd2+/Zn2+-exporting ATPase
MSADMTKEKPSCSCKKSEVAFLDASFWIVIARLTVSLILVLLGYFVFSEGNYGVYVNFAVMFLAWVISGYDIVCEAFQNVFKEKNPFDENMLMVVASIGAFCLRFFGPDDNDFLEAVMVVLLYQVGEIFEGLATAKSHKAITDAVGLRAKFASKLIDGKVEEVDPISLAIGDKVIVKVGEILPADGTIVQGGGSLDMSSLTGEFVPVEKKEGEFVNSGTILKSGSIVIRVDKTYEDSTVSKIITLVEDSAKSKSDATRFIDRFSKTYTPIVVGLAILVAILPPLFINLSDGAVWSHWVYIALCLLLISCPCAIVISVPLAYFAGIGLASKRGIIVKGAVFFDKLDKLGYVVTDKTGTLTYGDFKVTKVVSPKLEESVFMEYLRAAESRSTHPIALAIVGESDSASLANRCSNYEEFSGQGISTDYQGHHLLSGNKRFLSEKGLAVPEEEENGTIVYLAVDNEFAGYVILNDVIRKESEEMVAGLKKLGVRTCMLTGDKEIGARAVAEKLGLDEYHSELLPDDKRRILEEKISAKSGYVAYMGDGINDAPSITLADVGVAMGGVGSDLAVENADVVIMNDDPSKMVAAIKIAKRTKAKAYTNIAVALAMKLAFMLLSIFLPNFPLLVAVLADTGLTVLLVGNSLLLLHVKKD